METINNLIVEVTRRCNMCCEHCLRGDQEMKDIQKRDIEALLSQVDYISNVTFTGGEPSLNTEAIMMFMDIANLNNVGIGSFYIATNGKEISEDFVITCLRLYSLCDEKEMCGVDISNDGYHDGDYNTELLDGLSFAKRKHEKEGYDYDNGNYLISEGYANDNGLGGRGRTLDQEEITTKEEFNDTEIYLNCNGDIINGCDWSYDSQDEMVMCKVGGLSEFYEALED